MYSKELQSYKEWDEKAEKGDCSVDAKQNGTIMEWERHCTEKGRYKLRSIQKLLIYNEYN